MNRVLSDRSVNWSRVSKYTSLPQYGNAYTKLAMLLLKAHTGDSRKHWAKKVTSSKSSSGDLWGPLGFEADALLTERTIAHYYIYGS